MNEWYYTSGDGKRFLDPTPGGTVMEAFVRDSLEDEGVVDTFAESTNWHTKFCRYGFMDPYNALVGAREYIFFTRPDLNLLGPAGDRLARCTDDEGYADGDVEWDLNNNDYLVDTFCRFPQLFDQWTTRKGAFMNMITNSAKSTLELPGTESKDIETAANIFGSKITYRGTSWSSDEQFNFNLEFQDNKYLEMYHLFKIYDEYERLKAVGRVTPRSTYRMNRVIHDQFTAFKIVVGADGRELLYWGRATGCFPTSFPRDSFNNLADMLTDSLRFSISFRAHFAKDFSPSIIQHFNSVSLRGIATKKSRNEDMDFYIPTDDIPVSYNGNKNMKWAVRPYIVRTDRSDFSRSLSNGKPSYKYELIWLDH